MNGGDQSAMRAAAMLLEACDTTRAALNAVMRALGSPGVDIDWWLRVYAAVEDLGMVREAVRRHGLPQ